MQSHEAMEAAHLALLEGAILALLRAADEDGLDGLTVVASASDGQTSIDFYYTAAGLPVAGESL